MDKGMKLLALVLISAAVARADDKPPSTEDAQVVSLADAKWKPAPARPEIPPGLQFSPFAVDPHTKGPIAYVKFPAGYKFPRHSHSHTEYSVLLAGNPILTLEGKPHPMAPGGYVVIPAKVKHSLDCGPDAECILLIRRAGPTDYDFGK